MTWLSGGHVQTEPQRVTVRVRFTDAPTVEHERVFVVPMWGRWAMTLDDLRPGFVGVTDAVVRVMCEGQCWAESALWHAPIGRGVVPTVTRVWFACEGNESP